MPFQELCRDLLRAEAGVKECHIYGMSGQRQFGIDLEARLHSGGCWVGQCKAYEEMTLANLRDAAEEFWEHRARWKERGAKRFIVLAGCGIEDTKVWDQEREQKKKFLREGVDFELWDSRELSTRLNPHRSIVERHCRVDWADIICGASSASVTVTSGGAGNPSLVPLLPLVDEISGLRDQRLTEIRELIRAGKELSAERELEAMCRAPSWEQLLPKIRARALRQRIGLMLGRRQDVAGARILLEEAKTIAPEVSLKVPEALIAYHAEGGESALKILTPAGDVDEWNLQLAILLSLGRAIEALKELDAPRFQPDAETWRLRAVAMISTRNISGARLAIEKALAINPAWRRLREAAAVIDYYSALSPAVDSWLNFEWPAPCDWNFVRRDDESIVGLRRAAAAFEALAAAPEITETERKGLEVWHLAALANDSAREIEAATLARTLLEQEPGHVRIAIWASHRGYEFNRASVRAALERECIGELKTIEPVQALFVLLANENEVAAAGRVLDVNRELYERLNALSIWRFERAQAWMAVDEKEKARALLTEEIDVAERGKLEAALVRVEAARGGPRAEVARIFAQRFEETKADADLLFACEAHLHGKLPEYVATHAQELVQRIGTESALRLALDGSFAAGQYDLCLSLLARHIDLFHGHNPPPVVHRLRVECLRRSGRLAEAQRAAELLAKEAAEPMDLFAVFETQRTVGDMAAAAMTGRQLLSHPDISSEGLLHLSLHLRNDAPDVAKEAFEELLKQGVTTAQAATATQVGFDLGFDDQIDPLITQAIAGAAGQPGASLVPFTIAETLQMMDERRNAREENAATYGRGEIPIHLYAQAHRIPLAGIFRSLLLLNEGVGCPLGSFTAMIRHGSLDTPRSLSSDNPPGLFLDVTSFLLAGHLDLLDKLEAEFAPIQISPHLPSSLQEQLAILASEQVARQPAKTAVLDLIAEQRIVTIEPDESDAENSTLKEKMGVRWCALLAHAQKNDGYLIEFLPLRSNDTAMEPVVVSADIEASLRSPGDLVQALKQSGAITAEQYENALQRAGRNGAGSRTPTDLNPGAYFVILEGTTAEILAYAGVLRPLTDRCRVAIDIEEHRRLLSEAETRRTRMELVAWLRQLRDRLRRGLHAGTYETKGSSSEAAQEANFVNSATGSCVWDLLDQKRSPAVWTCCDDRFIGRFEKVGESRLVDIFDLLHELRSRGRISTGALFSLLARLRGSNARYLPISHEEIVHQLRRAEMNANGLIETPELASLRRYTAACVMDKARLQRPPPSHPRSQELTEIKCIMTFYSAGSEALMQLWGDDSLPQDRLIASSDWLLHQFLFDIAGAIAVWNEGNLPPALWADTAGLSHANLFFRAIVLAGKHRSAGKEKAARQKMFIRWLMTRLEPDAPSLAQLGGHLREALMGPVRMAKTDDERLMAAAMCGELYTAFPQNLQHAVGLTKADLAALKLVEWKPMELGEYSFDLRDFFRATEKALRRGEAALTARIPAGLKFCVYPEPAAAGRLTVVLESKEAKKRMTISDTALGLMQSDPERREVGLRAERSSLDVSTTEAGRVFSRIALIKNLDERLRQYYALRENSLALHFSSLATRFTLSADVHTGELRPRSTEAILRHLRLGPVLSDGELPSALDSSAETLITDEGFEEAFVRVATLPVALPAAFAKAFANLELERRDKWVRQALNEIKTPIMRLHLAGLLLQGSEDEVGSAVDVLCGFAGDVGLECYDAFEEIFSWVYREIISTAKLDLPEATILTATWAYAARLHQLLSAHTEQVEIVRSFEEGAKPRPRELLRSQHKIWLDAAGPQMITRETLAVHGIAALLEGQTLADDLHEKIGEALRRLCFPFAASPTLPALPLLRNRATQRNVLGSFLPACRTDTLADYIGVDALRFSDEQIQTEIHGVISRLSDNPSDKEAWSNLICFLGMHPPSAELEEKFRGCMLATDWTKFVETNEATRQGILLFLSSQAANFPDCETLAYFRLQLTSVARRFAATLKEHSPIEKAAQLLANCAHFQALSAGEEMTAASALVSILDEICQAWPKAAVHIWPLYSTLLLRQPSSTVVKLWPLIFRFRATSARLEA